MSTEDFLSRRSDGTALMIYDGDCGFCTYWAHRWKEKIGRGLEVAPLQDSSRVPSLVTTDELEEAVHLVGPDRRVRRGAAAVFRAMALRRRYALGWWLYRRSAFFRRVSEWFYRWVAGHRALVSRWTRWLRREDGC